MLASTQGWEGPEGLLKELGEISFISDKQSTAVCEQPQDGLYGRANCHRQGLGISRGDPRIGGCRIRDMKGRAEIVGAKGHKGVKSFCHTGSGFVVLSFVSFHPVLL